MNFKKKGKALRILTGVLTVGIIFAAVFIGNYHEASTSMPANIDNDLSIQSDEYNVPYKVDTASERDCLKC